MGSGPCHYFWLAPTAILQSLISTTGSVFMSQNKTNILVLLTIFNAFLQLTAFVVGGFFNVLLLVKLYFSANFIMFFPNVLLAVRCFNGTLYSVFMCIYKPLISSFVMALIVYMVNVCFLRSMNSDLVKLLISVVFGSFIYVLFIYFFDRDLIKDLRQVKKGVMTVLSIKIKNKVDVYRRILISYLYLIYFKFRNYFSKSKVCQEGCIYNFSYHL